ncbi:hypothetical protein O9929_22270 [Vibrio lentus]|nr:hypothetical protein [Vibrio lentus]
MSNAAQNEQPQAEHKEQIEKAEKQGKRGVKLGALRFGVISVLFSAAASKV